MKTTKLVKLPASVVLVATASPERGLPIGLKNKGHGGGGS